MRVFLLLFIALCSSHFAQAYPTWSNYRTMNETNRADIDQAMLTLVAKIQADGLKTKHIKFCAADLGIWETSLNASCSSTKSAAMTRKWPPVITNEGFEPSWVAHARLATAYCAQQPAEKVCITLELGSVSNQGKVVQDKSAQNKNLKLYNRSNSLNWAQLLTLAIPKASAAEVCKVENDTMTTKSGATIYLDFGVQPGQAHAAALTELARISALDQVTDGALRDNVESLLKIGKVLVSNARLKQPWVQAHINQGHVTWIGTEFTERELGDRTGKKMASSFDELKTQLKSRYVTKAAASDAMTIGACPTAPACAWLQDANLRATTSLVPLASDDLKQQMNSLQQKEATVLSDLKALGTNLKITKEEYTAIEREYRNLLIAEDPPDTNARNKARLRYSVPEVSKAMVALYDLATAIKKNSAERDQAVALTALAQSGNGIFAMGTRARDTMVPLLESACRGPIAPPPPPVGKKTVKPTAKTSTLN